MLNSLLLALTLVFQGQADLPKKHMGAKPATSKVIAKVNGQDITASDLEPYLWDWAAAAALEDLIMYKVVSDEANRLALKVDDAEVEAEFQKQMQAYAQQLPPGKTPEEALAERHFSKSRIYMGLKREMLVTKIVDREFSAVGYVKVSTITVKPKSEQVEDVSAAITSMNEAYARLKKGDKWETVLRSVTFDENVVRANGLIGWRSLRAFPETVQNEIKTLKAGDITKPAQTQFGIQLFRIEAKGEAAKGEDLEDLKAQFQASARGELLTRLRSQAKIERLIGK